MTNRIQNVGAQVEKRIYWKVELTEDEIQGNYWYLALCNPLANSKSECFVLKRYYSGAQLKHAAFRATLPTADIDVDAADKHWLAAVSINAKVADTDCHVDDNKALAKYENSTWTSSNGSTNKGCT